MLKIATLQWRLDQPEHHRRGRKHVVQHCSCPRFVEASSSEENPRLLPPTFVQCGACTETIAIRFRVGTSFTLDSGNFLAHLRTRHKVLPPVQQPEQAMRSVRAVCFILQFIF